MGGGRRGSGSSKGGRLAAGWWSHLNTAYRAYLTEHGQKPERPWLEEWFEKHARAAWPNGDQPSIQAAWDHCKCLRTLDQARDYFRQYRAKKKDERDGGPVRTSRKRNVDTDETPSEELDEDEGESSSQEDDDDNNGGPSRQKQRKAPPRRKPAPKSQPGAQEDGSNSMAMMQFQNMLMQQQQQQQQQAMSFPQMMMGGYPMGSDPSAMMMGGMGGGMNPEAFNSFPFQMWQQQQQMLAMMMAQQQVQAAGGVGDATELAQQQQSLAAAMMMAQQQQMAMMLHLHQQHALSQGSLEQRPVKEEDIKVKEEDRTAPVDEAKEGSEGKVKDIPPPLPPPPPNPILGPVVMFPAAYAPSVIPPYPALSTYGFDCSSYSSTMPSSAVPSLFVKTLPPTKKTSVAGAKSQISSMSDHLRMTLENTHGNGSHCSSRATEDRLMPRQCKGEEDSGTSDREIQDNQNSFANRKKRSSSSETMADENGMPLSHARPQTSPSQPHLPFASSLDTLLAAAEVIGSKSDE